MSGFFAAVYDPPSSKMPYVAIIVSNEGEVLLAQAVSSVQEGEARLSVALQELKRLADEDARGSKSK